MMPALDAEAWIHREAAAIARDTVADHPTDVLSLSIAGVALDLVLVGAGVRDAIAPALEHARVPGHRAQPWRVVAWDSSTGAEVPRPHADLDFLDNGELARFGRGSLRTSFHYADQSVTGLDLEARSGFLWVRDATALPAWARAAPCRALLSWLLGAEGRVLVHGAAVGDARARRGLLLVGPGGAGKSTTTALAVGAGLLTCGDDYIALSGEDGRVRAHAVFGRAKLTDGEAATAPPGWQAVGATPEGKQIYDIAGAPGWTDSLDIDVVAVAARRAGTGTIAVRVEPAEPLAAVAVPTVEQISYWRHAPRLWQLMSTLSTARLELGERDGVVRGLRAAMAGELGDRAVHWAPVSVVIPLHNGAGFLPQAVASIRAQRCGEVEVVVVDDASDADPTALCAELGVRLVRLDVNRGPAAARNAGVRATTHDVIGFLDADDRWTPYALAPRLRALLDDPALLVVRGAPRLVDPQGEPVSAPGKDDFPSYIGTGLFRRRAFEVIGGFSEELRFGEDVDWFLRLNESGQPHRILPLDTLEVVRHGGNVTEGRDVVQLGVLAVARLAMQRRRTDR